MLCNKKLQYYPLDIRKFIILYDTNGNVSAKEFFGNCGGNQA